VPLFIVLSTDAPKEVKANKELYDHICLRNHFERASPSNLSRLARGAGGLLYCSRLILFDLQQRLYTVFLFDRFEALLTLSWNQKQHHGMGTHGLVHHNKTALDRHLASHNEKLKLEGHQQVLWRANERQTQKPTF
jgi:hypothetical protein